MSQQVQKRKNPFRNEGKVDLPRDKIKHEVQKFLGKNVSVKFIEWYRQDFNPEQRGWNIPWMNYSGPGNPTRNGRPVNEADKFAQLHDIEYAHTSFLFANGKITEAQHIANTREADMKFLKSNGYNMTSSMDPREQLASVIGSGGIGVKTIFERIFGQQYPNTVAANTFKEHPQGENKLKNLLMKNLEKNISEKPKPVEDSSVYDDNWEEHEISELESVFKSASEKKQMTLPDDDGPSQPKQAKIDADVPPQIVAHIPDVEMGLTGTGKEQASGGASSDGQMVYSIPRPISDFGDRTNVYTKVHKFMTFGFADAFVATGDTSINQALTSYLAEVPWHIPALYMNPSEYALLSNSARVKSVSIEVVYRGSTIQFETAATATGLATLNQINDIAVANGLNRTGWGSNVSYGGFSSTQPMIPTIVAKPKYKPAVGFYRGMVRDYYGSDNNTAEFTGDVPKHQTGRQTFLYNYWATTARASDAAVGNNQFGGWPCLAEKIEQMDGKTVVNQVVLQSTYSPKLAPLKPPLRSASHGLPFPEQNGTLNVAVGGNLVAGRQAGLRVANVAPSSSAGVQIGLDGEILLNSSNAVTVEPTFDIYSPIEKCQMGRSGFWGENDVHIQPSIHIGVQPVPALSSASLLAEDAAFNNWTDTRAYWEVKATMVTYEHNPTAWPYAPVANVPFGENVVWNPTITRPKAIVDASDDGATFCGLYTNSSLF